MLGRVVPSNSLHYNPCNASGASDGVIHRVMFIKARGTRQRHRDPFSPRAKQAHRELRNIVLQTQSAYMCTNQQTRQKSMHQTSRPVNQEATSVVNLTAKPVGSHPGIQTSSRSTSQASNQDSSQASLQQQSMPVHRPSQQPIQHPTAEPAGTRKQAAPASGAGAETHALHKLRRRRCRDAEVSTRRGGVEEEGEGRGCKRRRRGDEEETQLRRGRRRRRGMRGTMI